MKRRLLLVLLFALLASLASAACSSDRTARTPTPEETEQTVEPAEAEETETAPQAELEVVAELDRAPGNITVPPDGRPIISLHQFYEPQLGVARVLEDGSLEPFPNAEWSQGTEAKLPRLHSVLGLQSTPEGIVWMLSNGLRGNNTPALLAWDTNTDEQHAYIELPEPITAANSFVNDLAVDTDTNTIYIADPAGGDNAAIIVVDIESRQAKRVLEGHPSVVPEDIDLVVDGEPVERLTDTGETVPARTGVNPIALDADNEWLYFGAMHGESLYRIKTATLRGEADDAALADAVERYADKPISDGISMDREGNIYVTDLADNAVGVITLEREYRRLAADARLEWPDAFSFGPDGKLYVVSNQLHKSPPLNAGEDGSEPPFYIFRLEPLAEGVVGR